MTKINHSDKIEKSLVKALTKKTLVIIKVSKIEMIRNNKSVENNCHKVIKHPINGVEKIDKLSILINGVRKIDRLLIKHVIAGRLDLAKFSIQKGADVNCEISGISMIRRALILNTSDIKFDMIELLIDHGANINTQYHNRSLLGIAATAVGVPGSNFTRYLLQHPQCTLNDDIVQSISSDIGVNPLSLAFIRNMANCELLYHQSKIKQLSEFFNTLSEQEKKSFIVRQVGKFKPDIKFFQTTESVTQEIKNLYEFCIDSKNQETQTPIIKFLNDKIDIYHDRGTMTLQAIAAFTCISNKMHSNITPDQIPNRLINYLGSVDIIKPL